LLMEPRCSLAQKKSVNPFWDKLRHQLLRSRFYRNTIEIVASKKKKGFKICESVPHIKTSKYFFCSVISYVVLQCEPHVEKGLFLSTINCCHTF
jgi:hypothetical protein